MPSGWRSADVTSPPIIDFTGYRQICSMRTGTA
jgi:hypothetical protein